MEKFKGISTAIGGTVLMLYLGSVYVTGVIAPYIRSYYDVENEMYVAQLMPCVMVLNILTVPAGSTLVHKNVNPKYMVFIGGLVSIFLLFMSSFCTTYPWFMTCYVLG